MKATVKIEKEIELVKMHVSVDVRYWEDAMINGNDVPQSGEGLPCKDGDCWCPRIDIETGRIENWDIGTIAAIHFKVCDQCSFKILDDNGEVVFSVENYYVPKVLCPKEAGYGDYVIMDITSEGFIENWNKEKILEIFNEED